jgi:2'-5' RNA ligase
MHDEGMASNETEFWENRYELDSFTGVANGSEDYRLALLFDITDSVFCSAGRELVETLSQFECFAPSPAKTFHITVKIFDISVSPSTTGADNVPPSIRRVDDAVSSVLPAYHPFEIQFPKLNLFPDVVYSEVVDHGQLASLNRKLCKKDAIASQARDDDNYIPHLTLGYFRNSVDYSSFIRFIENNREVQFPVLPVETLSLVAYNVDGHPPTYDRVELYEL